MLENYLSMEEAEAKFKDGLEPECNLNYRDDGSSMKRYCATLYGGQIPNTDLLGRVTNSQFRAVCISPYGMDHRGTFHIEGIRFEFVPAHHREPEDMVREYGVLAGISEGVGRGEFDDGVIALAVDLEGPFDKEKLQKLKHILSEAKKYLTEHKPK